MISWVEREKKFLTTEPGDMPLIHFLIWLHTKNIYKKGYILREMPYALNHVSANITGYKSRDN